MKIQFQIYEYLSKYVVGQHEAKRVLARAVYYHYKRLRVNIPEQDKQEQTAPSSGNYERVKSMKSPKGTFFFNQCFFSNVALITYFSS